MLNSFVRRDTHTVAGNDAWSSMDWNLAEVWCK